MNTTPKQQRGMYFLTLKENGLSQKQIKDYCIQKHNETFSPATISRGIADAKLINEIQKKEMIIHESLPEVDVELITVVLRDSCVRKFRKS